MIVSGARTADESAEAIREPLAAAGELDVRRWLGATLEALCVPPYFGSDRLEAPARVAELVERNDFLPTFCLHYRRL